MIDSWTISFCCLIWKSSVLFIRKEILTHWDVQRVSRYSRCKSRRETYLQRARHFVSCWWKFTAMSTKENREKKGIEKRKKREYKTSLTFDVAAVRPFHVNPAQKFRSGTSNFQAAPPRRSRRVTREKIISMRNATLEHASPFIRPEWRGAGGGSAFRADVARVSRVRVRGIDERNLVAAVTQEKGKEGNERKTQLDVLVRLFSPWFAVFRNHGTKQNTYVPRSIFNKTIGWPLFCCRCQTERAHGQATRVVIAEAKGRIYERVKSAVWRAKNYFPCVRPVSRCSCAQRALCRAYVRR